MQSFPIYTGLRRILATLAIAGKNKPVLWAELSIFPIVMGACGAAVRWGEGESNGFILDVSVH